MISTLTHYPQATSPAYGHPSVVTRQPAVTTARLLRWSGAANIAAGLLTIAGNALHPPRSFATLPVDALLPAWEAVHALGAAALVVTLFALMGLYACQVERSGGLGLAGFVGAVTGVAMAIGVLIPDAFVFPVLARHEATVGLLQVPGALIPGGAFGRYLVLSGVVYALGYAALGAASLRAGVLPRWGAVLLLAGVWPMLFGALVLQGLDVAGAALVGAGHAWCGLALWRGRREGAVR